MSRILFNALRQGEINIKGEKKMLTAEQIQAILPHRYPFLFVDRIVELEEGKRAVGLKNVSMNEDFF